MKKGSWLDVLKHAWNDFGADRCSDLAAALSYYTIFSIPPLIILALLVLGIFMSPAEVQQLIQSQTGGYMGPQAAAGIQTIMQNARQPAMGRGLVGIIGGAALVFSALGYFLSLQSALNRAWDVAPDPKLSMVKHFLLQRLSGFIAMVVIAIVLLASLVLASLASTYGGYVVGELPGALTGIASQAIAFGISLVVTTVLFTLLFKLLPDASMHWGDAWLGGFVTAVLFAVGKLLIGLYLGHSHPGSAFGAAGSIILVLVWIYYSSLILLLGAELTQAYAVERGGGVWPKAHGVRIVEARAPNRIANRPDSASAPEHVVPEQGEGEGPQSAASREQQAERERHRDEGQAAD